MKLLPFVVLGLVLWTGSTRAEVPRISAAGVQLPGCQLYSDAGFELLDWNRDGKLDVFLSDPSMISGSVYLNQGSPTHPKLGSAFWYPLNLTESEPYGMYFVQTQTICDLNHDGLFDMLVFDGQLRMLFNTGTTNGPNHWNLAMPAPYFPGTPQMIKENSRLTLTPETMYWSEGLFPRQVSTMTVADWDGDGLEDLLICRFKEEAPGVVPNESASAALLALPDCRWQGTTWNEKLAKAPARGLYFYKNVGTRAKPWFDAGVEITPPDGQSIAAPNPAVMDMDGDGIPDLVSTETAYACNSYRVDWPTQPAVMWFKRSKKTDTARLEPGRPVLDAAGKAIPAGVQARFADMRSAGAKDLLVLDPLRGLRWYPKSAKGYDAPTVLQGMDFARFSFMYQPVVVNWFGPKSSDLILHGCIDSHCQAAFRRTALYRNVAQRPGELKYEFAGFIKYRDDPAMVPQAFPFEDRVNDIYGSYVAMMPDDGTGQKRLVMSVSGKLYLFSNLAADGLTFAERKPLNIPNPNRNWGNGWQEFPVSVPGKVQYIRLTSKDDNSPLYIVSFEALATGKNWTDGAQVNQAKGSPGNPQFMFTPGNQPSETRPNYTSFHGPAVITLKEPVALEKIRLFLSDREPEWYSSFWPFTWQGKAPRRYTVAGAAWYKYKVEVSADQTNWTVVGDRRGTEMMRSCPVLVDWNGDGKADLVLGVVNALGVWPMRKEYRLYLNKGTNAEPKFDEYVSFCDETGKPLDLYAHWAKSVSPQCGVAVLDRNGDGKVFDVVVEDEEPQGGLRYYENVSTAATKELRFKFVKLLGDPVPINYPSGYRYFHYGDADGDGVPDVINCTSAAMAFFKGVSPGAPRAVTDLAVTGSSSQGLELRWTKPPGAIKYDLRVSDGSALSETDWTSLPSVTGEYTVADGAIQTAQIPPSPGRELTVAVKSSSTKGETSALSNGAHGVAPPLKRIVLHNGPDYTGTQACTLDAGKPTQPMPKDPSKLEVRALNPQPLQKQKLILIRFTDLPRTTQLEQATLELTTDPQFEPRYSLLPMATEVETSCSVIRDDWDAATATYTEAAPGKPWAAGELDAGGTFISKSAPQFTVLARRTLSWDITPAVREALKAGRTSISLLIRAEYTGKYVGGVGYNFCGPNWPQIESRPRLSLVTRP